MRSKTKVTLDKKTILGLIKHNISNDEVLEIFELNDGWFNTAYKIKFTNKFSCVLKVGPPIDSEIMSYEANMMEAEIACMNLISENTLIPCPKILFSDLTRNVIPYQFFFMEYIQGETWANQKDKISSQQNDSILKQLGKITAVINSYKGEGFGYFNLDRKFDSWFDALYWMCSLLFKDALKYKIDLPLEEADFLRLLEKFKFSLDEVKQPKLIHWDLSPANIFVRENNSEYELTGVIDFERAIWGDPLMENILFDLNDINIPYFDGYNENLLETQNQKIRRLLYNMYLCLVMVIEDGPRDYDDKGSVKWAYEELEKCFKILNAQGV